MFKHTKTLALMLCLAFAGSLLVEDISYAQRRSSSSRRPSTSSRPSTGSKPKFGSSSRPSTSKPRFGSSSRPSTSKPKFGSSTRPSTAKPSTSSKPKFGSGTSSRPGSTSSSKPKFGSSNSTSRQPTTANPSSRRPTTSSSSKVNAQRRATSQRVYKETKKATAPPKPSYTDSRGNTVKVRTNSSHVSSMRSRPSSYYTPAARQTRITNHIHVHGYGHPYSYYHTQPYYHVGGGYSSAFWWMMLEWNADRRARWLYHNRHNIEADAYRRGMQDAQVAQQVAALEAQGVARNADYVDPEFADNPGMQYSQEYVEAAYNPTVVASSGGSAAGSTLMWIVVIFIGVIAIWFVMTKLRWGT